MVKTTQCILMGKIKTILNLNLLTCSIASPDLTMETPQLPLTNCKPLYWHPVGVVIVQSEYGSWFKPSSTTKRIQRKGKRKGELESSAVIQTVYTVITQVSRYTYHMKQYIFTIKALDFQNLHIGSVCSVRRGGGG